MPTDDDLLQIRKTIITAVASDEYLVDRLVLKGGNALDIVYRLDERASLDIDFSLAGDFTSRAELEDVQTRLFSALRARFDTIDLVVFDERLSEKPRNSAGPGLTVWGGYDATFKLLTRSRYYQLGGKPGQVPEGGVLDAMRRESIATGPGDTRQFRIEISKFEYCDGKVVRQVDDYDCSVYSPAMLAAEKLRAICQQLPQYLQRRNPAPRPRDFLDIYTIEQRLGVNIAAQEHHPLLRAVFSAKQVPLELLSAIGNEAALRFHEQGWPSVLNLTRRRPPHDFAHYFAYTVDKASTIHLEILAT